MKILRIFTGIYAILVSIILIIAPIITATIALILYTISDDGTPGSEGLIYGALVTDIIFRVIALTMIIPAFILKSKSEEANKDGQKLIIIAGFIVVILSSLLGIISGILGIIGAVLVLTSNKNIIVKEPKIELENWNIKAILTMVFIIPEYQ